MGSHFACETFDGNLNSIELRSQYEQRVDELTHEHGTDPYNGTLATTTGLRIHGAEFESRDAAEQYVSEHTTKWGAAMAVRYKDIRTEPATEPTFEGKPVAGFGYLSVGNRTLRALTLKYTEPGRRAVAADQLTAAQQVSVLALFNDYDLKEQAFNVLHRRIAEAIAALQDLNADPPTTVQLRELQKAIKQRVKARAAAKKAADKLTAFDEKHAAKLYTTKQVDHGLRWLVGGWASC